MNPLATLAASLVAVLALAGIARLLRLGGGRIESEAAAIEAAEAMLSGFEAARAVLGADGQAALVPGRAGDAALLKVHGAHIAARRLAPGYAAVSVPEGLRIDSGDARFGAVVLMGIHAL
ncbi:hypothetical protein ACG3SL_18840 [Sphingomonas sp. CJ20]